MNEYKEIPEWVYNQLPSLLKTSSSHFKEPYERDMYTMAQIALIGGCFPNVQSTYNNKSQFPFINLFISAKAGMGKSVIMFARYAIEGINTKDNNKAKSMTLTSPQFHRNLIISGNISASALLSQLEANGGVGIIFETEADTITNSIAQDWGNFSDTIRKATHHEPISLLRKKDKESIYISSPKLATVLSGTPDQVKSLIPSTENGLFSRFLYLSVNATQEFKDGRPTPESVNLEQLFKTTISNQFLEIYDYFQGKEVTITFTDYQWDESTRYWKLKFDNIKYDYQDFTSVILRLAPMTFRIAMILTIIRAKENNLDLNKDIICTDQDFVSAINITHTLQEHAAQIYATLPNKNNGVPHSYEQDLIKMLPPYEILSRKEVISIWGIPDRTASARLKRFIETDQLVHAEYGNYFVGNKKAFDMKRAEKLAESAESAESADSTFIGELPAKIDHLDNDKNLTKINAI